MNAVLAISPALVWDFWMLPIADFNDQTLKPPDEKKIRVDPGGDSSKSGHMADTVRSEVGIKYELDHRQTT